MRNSVDFILDNDETFQIDLTSKISKVQTSKTYLSVHLSVYLCIYLSVIYLSAIYPTHYLPIYLFI